MSEVGEGTRPARLSTADPVESWAECLVAGDRRTLARLLTFAESSREDQQELVEKVLAYTPNRGCFRVAFSGAPGVGKSSILETLGGHLVDQGVRLAVLSIDPTSQLSGGSILADKTRMTHLSTSPYAYVRPSPSGLHQGGVARFTSKCLALCDRAGFDNVFLETVGVGQTELAAAHLVDCFVMIVSPSGGDELQGMKRGITEHADIFVVNKLDQDPSLAKRTQENYAGALKLLRGVEVPALALSAHKNQGIEALWGLLSSFKTGLGLQDSSLRDRKEREQEFFKCVEELATRRLKRALQDESGRVVDLFRRVSEGEISPACAATDVFHMLH